MKMNKIMMLALAGMAFAACSNDDEVGNLAPEGVGAVSIRIVSPDLTRAVGTATSGSNVTVAPQTDTEVTITLAASEGGNTITLTPDEWASGKTVTFWNVKSPTSVSVSMNGGVADYSSVNIATGTPSLQVDPAAIPVYGTTSAFTATTGSVVAADEDVNGSHDAGLQEDNVGTTYPVYTATVQLEIPVARLEVGPISHTNPCSDCMFSALTINGVYMDNIMSTDGGALTDYQFLASNSGTGVQAILREEVNSTTGSSFLGGAQFPASDQVYAFNFYGQDAEGSASNNPQFKIYFGSATGSSEAVASPRYAMIQNYYAADDVSMQNPIVLQNGHIYQIKDVVLADKNIIPDENGNTAYAINVTVTEAAWTVETTNASWAE